MTVDAIVAVGTSPVAAKLDTAAVDQNAGPTFLQWFDHQVSATDQKIKAADQSVQNVILGKTDNLHRVMMDIEAARMSLDLVVQVRNRVVEAYQELMRMQV